MLLELRQLRIQPGQQLLLSDVSWQQFENILAELGEHRAARLSYSHGFLEIIVPLLEHEKAKEIIGDMIKILLEARQITFESLGSTTLKNERMTQAVEPDACFYIQNQAAVIGKNRLDMSVEPPPDLAIELEQMIDSGQIPGGSRILIDGSQSIPVAYVIAHKLAPLYEVIAVFDPRIGRGKNGYKTYIVTITNSQKYQVGDFIEIKDLQQSERSIIKVVLCGPPQSGKACLRNGLKRAILGNLGAPYPYVITACPDEEGSWYQEVNEINEELAKSIKTFYKADLTPEFAQEAAKWIRSANQLINIIDVD